MSWNITRSTGPEIWVTHTDTVAGSGQFVARFKYANKGKRATAFIKFLKANFTPVEYFKAREAGLTPLAILQSKGYAE